MPKKRLTEAQRSKLLEDTKQRIRLEQEARTKARLEELEIEVLENLGRQLLLEHLELSGGRARVSRNKYCKTVYARDERQYGRPRRRKDQFVNHKV
jgi:hypothetical protein